MFGEKFNKNFTFAYKNITDPIRKQTSQTKIQSSFLFYLNNNVSPFMLFYTSFMVFCFASMSMRAMRYTRTTAAPARFRLSREFVSVCSSRTDDSFNIFPSRSPRAFGINKNGALRNRVVLILFTFIRLTG